MIDSRRTRVRPYFRQAILLAVGLLGLLSTAWVTREMSISAQERLEHRFQLAARERADLLVSAFQKPLDQLSLLQRLFHSKSEVDWKTFEKFVRPMVGDFGVLGVGWAPLVVEAERRTVEQAGKMMWGDGFAIKEVDPAGNYVPAPPRERYFPLFYSLSTDPDLDLMGVDMYSRGNRRLLLDQAIIEDEPAVSDIGTPSLLPHRASDKIAIIVMPVYRGAKVQLARPWRQAATRGVLLLALDVGDLFDLTNASAPQSGLRASLADAVDPLLLIHRWHAKGAEDAQARHDNPQKYRQEFELGSRTWVLEVEAEPAWLGANASSSVAYTPVVGLLLTLLLLIYLRRLLGRSELVDTLEVSHNEDVEQRQAAEIWANKLSMAVEQNPGTILITDLDGRIEYVNKMFIETTGYSREEALGQTISILNPEGNDASFYRELLETISTGMSWRGELQTRRRDGTLFWERALIAPIRDRAGTITHYVSIKENISELREVMTRLQESENRFRGAMSVMLEGLAILSPQGVFLYANRAAEEILGCGEGGLQGRLVTDIGLDRLAEDGTLLAPEDYPAAISMRENQEVRNFVLGYRFPDNAVRWITTNSSPLSIAHEQNPGVVITLSDITQRRRVEEQLKLAFEAIRCSGEGILVTDVEQRILSVNPAFEAVTGFSADEILGKTPAYFASNRHDERFFAVMFEMLESTGHWQGKVWNKRKNGQVYPEWLGVSAVQEEEGRPKHYVFIFSDMTERQAAQEHIEFLAHHDPLTGLPNRLLLRDRAEQALAQAGRLQSRVALMFLDLDHFKTINDSLGHPVGDALLKVVVERLKGCVRESDTISRQGGDEFIVLLNDVRDSEAVSRVADKIQQCMGEHIVLGEHKLMTSFSIGVALFPDDGPDFDSLLQKADTAMYHAKEAGRNAHRFFTEQMNLQVVEHMTLQTQLRKALDNNEFVLHYQPQMDLHEGKIIGVEALIRWNSPENGLVSPAKFIPVAESSGLIVPIGAWVLNEACRQARAWQEAGLPPFVVAVNLSAVQFKRMDLVNTVINALVLSDLDSQWLELELTESILIQDAEATLDLVRRLKALGVKLSVDDFGTGYSSLAYLKRFAVDKLKIDQSFVRDLAKDPDDAAIVRAIIQMAHSLKLKTIAEGVEEEEVANLLRLFHCDELQGYWFARPMPAEQLHEFVRTHIALHGASAQCQ